MRSVALRTEIGPIWPSVSTTFAGQCRRDTSLKGTESELSCACCVSACSDSKTRFFLFAKDERLRKPPYGRGGRLAPATSTRAILLRLMNSVGPRNPYSNWGGHEFNQIAHSNAQRV